MSFLSKAEITANLPELDNITGSSDAIWQDEEKIVIEDVSSYLRNRYDVSEVFTATGTDRNYKIIELVRDILIYNLLSRVENADISVNRRSRYNGDRETKEGGAIGYLKSIQRGDVQLDLPLIDADEEEQADEIYSAITRNVEDYDVY